jgi:hypothetical protein
VPPHYEAAKGASAVLPMARDLPRKRIVPIILGSAMLAIVVAAGLSPNSGLVQAQTSPGYYGQPSSSTTAPWIYLVIAALVILVALLLALILLRRRRPPAMSAPAAQPRGVGSTPPSAPPGAAAPLAPVAGAAATEVVAIGGAGAAGVEPEPDLNSLMIELDKITKEILKRVPKKDEEGNDAGPGTASSVED